MRSALSRMRSPIRRVLALDAGDRRIRLVLGQMDFGRFKILKEELIELKTEGLLAPDEIKSHIQERLSAMGHPPVALIIPPHLSNSQVIELPTAADQDVDRLIQEETVKLSGASESRII